MQTFTRETQELQVTYTKYLLLARHSCEHMTCVASSLSPLTRTLERWFTIRIVQMEKPRQEADQDSTWTVWLQRQCSVLKPASPPWIRLSRPLSRENAYSDLYRMLVSGKYSETYHTVNRTVLFPRNRDRSSVIWSWLFLLATITIM